MIASGASDTLFTVGLRYRLLIHIRSYRLPYLPNISSILRWQDMSCRITDFLPDSVTHHPSQLCACRCVSWNRCCIAVVIQAPFFNGVSHACVTCLNLLDAHVLQKPLLERLLHECPDATGPNELFMVIGVMSTLAKENDLHTLRGFSEGLSPSVLADVVIANLDHIPRREDVAGAQAASSGTSALASLMQVSPHRI